MLHSVSPVTATNRRTIRVDLHTHSRFSFDEFSEPEEMVRGARQCGLQGLAISDHDTSAGVDYFRTARKAASWFSRAFVGWGSRAAELEEITPP